MLIGASPELDMVAQRERDIGLRMLIPTSEVNSDYCSLQQSSQGSIAIPNFVPMVMMMISHPSGCNACNGQGVLELRPMKKQQNVLG